MYVRILCLLCLFVPSEPWQHWRHERFSEESTSREMPGRILNLLKATYQDASTRLLETRYMRFAYEKTPFYEMGYVFAEIIERYKKMVEQLKRMRKNKNNILYDFLDRMEFIQKLYFEIYHLVNILHEIPRKYKNESEFKNLAEDAAAHQRLLLSKEAFQEAEEKRKKSAEKQKKKQKKTQKKHKLGLGFVKDAKKNKTGKAAPGNVNDIISAPGAGGQQDQDNLLVKKWPIDYGWELESWD